MVHGEGINHILSGLGDEQDVVSVMRCDDAGTDINVPPHGQIHCQRCHICHSEERIPELDVTAPAE